MNHFHTSSFDEATHKLNTRVQSCLPTLWQSLEQYVNGVIKIIKDPLPEGLPHLVQSKKTTLTHFDPPELQDAKYVRTVLNSIAQYGKVPEKEWKRFAKEYHEGKKYIPLSKIPTISKVRIPIDDIYSHIEIRMNEISTAYCKTLIHTPLQYKTGKNIPLDVLHKKYPAVIRMLSFGIQNNHITYPNIKTFLTQIDSTHLDHLLFQYSLKDIVAYEHKQLAEDKNYYIGKELIEIFGSIPID